MIPEQAGKVAALVLGSAIVGLITTHLVLITLVERLGRAQFEDTAVAWGLGHEYNAPSAFAAGVIVVASLLCAVAARRAQMRSDPLQRGWTILAVVLAFLAVDEAVQIHERLGERLDDRLELGGPLSFPWIVPYLVATAAVFVALLPFLRRIDPGLRRSFLIAGAIYVGGAAGVEAISGIWWDAQGDRADYVFHLISTVEEAMELTGMAVFVVVMINFLTAEGRSRDDGAEDTVPLVPTSSGARGA